MMDIFSFDYKSNFIVWCGFVIISFIMTAFISDDVTVGGVRGEITTKEHRTTASLLKGKELWCYHCNTMDSGDRCEKLPDNKTDHHLKCRENEKTCMVRSISLTTSTGKNISQPKLWLLERNCTKNCEPGCIVIGERTKLYACTKCCESDFCNSGKSSANYSGFFHLQYIVILFLRYILI